MATARHRQTALPDTPPAGRTRRWCRRCGRELTHPSSRMLGYGPACDPHRHAPTPPTADLDQDPIPGL
ncbi:MAG TPA: DUF6011 domain-containing protein [Streptomyces sp.]|nr:DUF6011 domain-containing protein [Streptomyces sp.]